jgi:hypothetical protein
VYIVYSIFNEGIAVYWFQSLKRSSYIFNNIYTVIEFYLFSYFFYLVVKNATLRKTILPFSLLFFLFASYNFFYLNKLHDFDSTLAGVEAIILLTYCIYYFVDELKAPTELLIHTTVRFWIVISTLIYFAGTFFLFIIAEGNMADRNFLRIYIIIASCVSILKNIILSVAMSIRDQKYNGSTSLSNTFPDNLDVLKPYETQNN